MSGESLKRLRAGTELEIPVWVLLFITFLFGDLGIVAFGLVLVFKFIFTTMGCCSKVLGSVTKSTMLVILLFFISCNLEFEKGL